MKTRKLIVGNLIGTILEVYDISIYAYFAPIIAGNFFPAINKNAALLNTLLIFMVSFIVRPLGAVIFGHIGDTLGRKKTLVLTISFITLGTFGIGILPDAHQIGFLAPLLLVVLRILQGLSFSVEFVGALVFLTEQSPIGRKNFAASWAVCGGTIGLLLASLVCCVISYVCNHQQLMSWGWRLPFLLAVFGGAISYYFRQQIIELVTLDKKEIFKYPLAQVFNQQKLSLLLVFTLAAFYMVICYLIYICSPTYISMLAKIPLKKALALNSAVLLLQVVMVPALGFWADKINKKTLIQLSLVTLIASVYPYYYILQSGNFFAVIAAHVGICFVAIFYSTLLPLLLTEIMPVYMRMSGFGLGYNIAATVAGGVTPVAAIYILKLTHGIAWLAVYFIAWAVCALVGTFYLSASNLDPADKPRDDDAVIPAQAGIYFEMDSRLRGNDKTMSSRGLSAGSIE